MEGIKTFCRGASAYVRVEGELSENFVTGVGVRHGYVISTWLFDTFMDSCMKEVKAKVGNSARLRLNRMGWFLVA